MTKYINILREHFGSFDYPVFTISDARVLLGSMHASQRYLKLMINHLIKKREIKRITKGVYTFHNDMAVIGFAYRPFYYGMEDALSYRNLWTQSTNPVIMTTNGVREGLRKFDGANYLVKRVKVEHFFGFDFIKHYDMWLPVSDPEKTLIDLVFYRHGVRRDALDSIREVVNDNKLQSYLKIYSRSMRNKVMDLFSTQNQK